MGLTKNNIKIIYWLFGLVFSGIIYYLIKRVSYFSFLNNSYLPYFIVLIIILLFFFIGLFSSKIPRFLFFIFRKGNIKDLKKDINQIKQKEDISKLIKNLKYILKYIPRYKKQKAIEILKENIGVDQNHAEKIVFEVNKQRKIKTFLISFGLFFSILLYFVLIKYPLFDYISNNFLVSLGVSLTVFCLFVLESYLFTRMPESFYLNLLDINKDNLEKKETNLSKNQNQIKDYKKQKDKDLEEIKKAIKFLYREHNLNRKLISHILDNYDLNPKISNKMMDDIESEVSQENKKLNKIPDSAKEKTIKLSLSKIHDNFNDLKNVYNKLKDLEENVEDLNKKYKNLKNFNQITNNLNENKKILNKKIVNFKKNINKENTSYYKMIKYLIDLILPYSNTYSKKEVFSMFLAEGFTYEVTDDVIKELEKQNDFEFKKTGFNLKDFFISSINRLNDL